SSGLDGSVLVWDVRSGEKVRTLEGQKKVATVVAFSPDGKTLAAGRDDGSVRLWDAATGAEREPLLWHTGPGVSLAYSPDGRHLASAGHSDGSVHLIDTTNGQLAHTFRREGGKEADVALAFSPDGKHLAAAWDAVVRLWDLEKKQETTFEG